MAETKPKFKDVIEDVYINYKDTGATVRVFEFVDSYEIDRVVIQFDQDDEIPHRLEIYRDGNIEEPSETMAFENTDISFTPISVIGRGEATDLLGVETTTDEYEDIPQIIQTIWKSIGFTVVPEDMEDVV